jgi:hypothetical protein
MKLRTKLIGGFAALVLSTVSASANITGGTGPSPMTPGGFQAEFVAGTGGLAGFDIFRLYALVSPTGTEAGATGLQSVDAIVTTVGNQKFKFTDYDFSDAVPDSDVLGKTSSLPTTNTTTVGTFLKVGSVGSFNVVTVLPPGYISDPDGNGTTDTDPQTNYAAVKSFRVAGFNTNPDTAGVGGNGGKGALFGVVVVPHGAGLQTEGQVVAQVAAEKGSPYTLTFDLLVPEPTSLGLISIGAIGLLARRRRQA